MSSASVALSTRVTPETDEWIKRERVKIYQATGVNLSTSGLVSSILEKTRIDAEAAEKPKRKASKR